MSFFPDAMVLKAIALVLAAQWLPGLAPQCHHLEGRGRAKAGVRFVHEHLAANTFVFRTDLKSYYASIDLDILLAMLEHHVPDRRVLDLLRQYVRRTIYDGGPYEHVERGIPLPASLWSERLAQNGAGRADSGAGHRAPGNRLRVNAASRQNRCAPCCAPALRPCRPLLQGSWALRSATWTKNQFEVGDFSDFVPGFS
jgi:hypothetical protein